MNKITNFCTTFDKANDVSFRDAANVATDDATLPQKTSKIMGLLKMGTRLDNKVFPTNSSRQLYQSFGVKTQKL